MASAMRSLAISRKPSSRPRRIGGLSAPDPRSRRQRRRAPRAPPGLDGDAEARRVQPAQQQVHVGEGQRPPGAVAGRARDRRPRSAGPTASAARRDSRRSSRRPRPRSRWPGPGSTGARRPRVLEAVVEVAVEARHVGAGAAHVEGDQPVEARPPRLAGPRPPRRPAGPLEQAVLGAEGPGAHQATGAGHHRQGRSLPRGPLHPLQEATHAPGRGRRPRPRSRPGTAG